MKGNFNYIIDMYGNIDWCTEFISFDRIFWNNYGNKLPICKLWMSNNDMHSDNDNDCNKYYVNHENAIYINIVIIVSITYQVNCSKFD